MRRAILGIDSFHPREQVGLDSPALMSRRFGVGHGDAAFEVALAPKLELLFDADATLTDAAIVHVPRLQRDSRIGERPGGADLVSGRIGFQGRRRQIRVDLSRQGDDAIERCARGAALSCEQRSRPQQA